MQRHGISCRCRKGEALECDAALGAIRKYGVKSHKVARAENAAGILTRPMGESEVKQGLHRMEYHTPKVCLGNEGQREERRFRLQAVMAARVRCSFVSSTRGDLGVWVCAWPNGRNHCGFCHDSERGCKSPPPRAGTHGQHIAFAGVCCLSI